MSSPLNVEISHPQEVPGNGHFRRYSYRKSGHRGNRVSPLPYFTMEARASGRVQAVSSGAWLTLDAPNVSSAYEAEANGCIPAWAVPRANKAYERFKEKALGENSALGVFAAETRESLGMVQNSALKMYRAARELRKGDLVGMQRALGITGRGKKVGRHRVGGNVRPEFAAETWLEYWFGWSPFLNEFYSVAEVMSQPLPGGRYYGSATASIGDSFHCDGFDISMHRKCRVRVGGEVYLENPNEFLRQQLGLANPAQIAWELVPFSFLVDWVTCFGDFLGSFTDFYGCEVRNAYYTGFCTWEETHNPNHWNLSGSPMQASGIAMQRYVGLYRPTPNLQFTANLGQSLTRTATAVSLLTTTLSSMVGRPR